MVEKESVESVDEFLGSPHREGGDDDLPAARGDPTYQRPERRGGVGRGVVELPGVGAFDDQGVDGTARRLWIADDRLIPAADVAREDEPVRGRAVEGQIDRRAAEDVSGVAVGDGDVLGDPEGATVRMCFDQLLHPGGIGPGVEWRRRRSGPTFFLQPAEVGLLDVGRVGEHDGAEVAGRRGGVDRTIELSRREEGEPPGVIDVGMGEHDGLDLPRIEGKRLIEPHRLLTTPLKEPGIQGDPMAAPLQQVTGPGHLTGGPPARQ